MLQEHSGGEGVDISLASSCRSADGLHGSQGDRGGESLIDIAHRETRPFRELGTHHPDLGGTRRLAAVGIEGSPSTKPVAPSSAARRTRAATGARFPARRTRWPAGVAIVPVGIAHRETDPPVAVVDAEEPRTKGTSGVMSPVTLRPC